MRPSRQPASVRSTSLDDIGDRDAPLGSKAWARWYTLEANKLRNEMRSEAKSLRDLLDVLDQYGAWKALGYASFSMYCYQECKLTGDQIDAIRTANGGEMLEVVLNPPGVKKHDITGNHITCAPTQRGTSEEYLAARLVRDRPDIKARLDAGEFKSVRAAAKAAGIVRPTAMFYTDSPGDAARAILRHFHGESLATLIRELQR